MRELPFVLRGLSVSQGERASRCVIMKQYDRCSRSAPFDAGYLSLLYCKPTAASRVLVGFRQGQY